VKTHIGTGFNVTQWLAAKNGLSAERQTYEIIAINTKAADIISAR